MDFADAQAHGAFEVSNITQEGDTIRFGPLEMATTVGYQIELR